MRNYFNITSVRNLHAYSETSFKIKKMSTALCDIPNENEYLGIDDDDFSRLIDANMEDELLKDESITPKTRRKTTKTKKIVPEGISQSSVTLASLQRPKVLNREFIYSDNLYDRKRKTDKKKSAKKTRAKSKFLSVLDVINTISNVGIPISLVYAIKKAKLELLYLDKNEQRVILEVAARLTKEEIAIMLLSIPDTAEEVRFLKNVVLTKQIIDNMFRGIDYTLVE